MNKFVFKDKVILDKVDTSRDVLNYLKAKKNQLLVYSNLSYEALNNKMQEESLSDLLDALVPYIDESFLDDPFASELFFQKIKTSCRDEILSPGFEEFFFGYGVSKKELPNTILISDQIVMCEEARRRGLQSIYYDKNKEIVYAKKIKTLSKLKNIY